MESSLFLSVNFTRYEKRGRQVAPTHLHGAWIESHEKQGRQDRLSLDDWIRRLQRILLLKRAKRLVEKRGSERDASVTHRMATSSRWGPA
ncbi:hypothetical protein C1H46_041407 [Malus baccata]|uniref:Uncharacterized protein n=1 Tax=Malus baccata TaxID=106549 RepID=A0A540KFQ1_MALBA|nr:hypothetical protein C1H46_041406 [Malus baccata]TQD73056.1 hypothetical protein C1H46_041407 [Malus baccata]